MESGFPYWAHSRAESPISKGLQVLGRSGLRRSLLIGLPSGFVGGAELILLLIYNVAAAIHPVRSLLAGLARAAAHVVASFFGSSAEHVPRLTTRTRRVEHSHHRTQTQPGQEPTKTVAITIRHMDTSRL